jgi:predicted metal-binding membrane protein
MTAMDLAVNRRDCCHEPGRARPPDLGLLGAGAALFAASAAGTVVWGASMAGMTDMTMPGGWTMSMAWMRMPDQTWLGAGASFLGMWTMMMVAMMLPSLVPVLWRYRQALREAEGEPMGRLTVLAGAAYFLVWAGQGAVVFPLGVAVAAAAMRWPAIARAVPLGTGLVVLAAGILQVSPWKARHLACCRGLRPPRPRTRGRWSAAWKHGLRLGVHCGACCVGLTAVLLVEGAMDLRVMAAVTVGVTAERLAPVRARLARAIGAILAAGGLFLIVRALRAG